MARRAAAGPVRPGDRFKQGTVCRITDDGAYIGLELKAGQDVPPESKLYTFGEARVALSDHQGAIPLALLER